MGYRFSKLSDINTGNAHALTQICTFPLGTSGSFQGGPIVYGGVLYTATAYATIAIDAATCAKQWQYDYTPHNPMAPTTRARPSPAAGSSAARRTAI